MKNTYIIATLVICLSFTGCIEYGDDDDDNSPSLRESVNNFINSLDTQRWNTFCSYFLEYEGTFFNFTEKEECINELESSLEAQEEYGLIGMKTTFSDYSADRLEYKASKTSGYVYSVSMNVVQCFIYSDGNNETNEEDCDTFYEDNMLWSKVGGKWGYGQDGFEGYYPVGESAPIATFFVEESSAGYYYAEVIKVSQQRDLEEFSYFLKDDSGSTYVGGNGFGEIAMQIINGEEHGIATTYSGDNEQLQSRASNVSDDDGSEFPVHFSDNDRDGKLSAGDRFTIYGTGNSANGPAEDGWRLDIQFDASGDIIGSAKLL